MTPCKSGKKGEWLLLLQSEIAKAPEKNISAIERAPSPPPLPTESVARAPWSNARWLYNRCVEGKASMQSELEPIDLCCFALPVSAKMRVDDVDELWALKNLMTTANYFRQVFKGRKSMDLTFLCDLCGERGQACQ